jgi:1,2-diacylglycerol 3-beta-galactosyltransferase
MIASHPSDLVVSVHPLANAPALRALGRRRPPYITVVTDLVTAHALWYHRNADLTIVPTQEAYRRAITNGLQPEKVRVVGLPVADRFCQPPGERADLRRQFGWPQERVVILLVGGGEGMGPLERTAHAVAAGCPQAALAIIAGRNQALKERLETYDWEIPTFIYGFTRQMPELMQAADILVTKAGPGTISEALIAGLPMVLYSRLPGQEDGNIRYVVAEGAGIWAPKPEQIVSALSNWIENPARRQEAVAACRRLARPQAARQIARLLAERVGVTIPQEES